MLGAIVNSISILVGGGIGCTLGNTLSKRYSEILLKAISVSVILIGLKSALETQNIILMICSMALGSLIGEFLRIEDHLNDFSKLLEKKFSNHGGNISQGFVTATLVYCIGAMAIVGAIESGVSNNHTTLFAKSILDGISAIVFASTLGIGVSLSAIAVFVYEGSITLLAGLLAGNLPMNAINELSAVGGLLILIVGTNLLEITKIKVGNMLPAVFLPLVYFMIKGYFI